MCRAVKIATYYLLFYSPMLYKLIKDKPENVRCDILREKLNNANIHFIGEYPSLSEIRSAKELTDRIRDLDGIDPSNIIEGKRRRNNNNSEDEIKINKKKKMRSEDYEFSSNDDYDVTSSGLEGDAESDSDINKPVEYRKQNVKYKSNKTTSNDDNSSEIEDIENTKKITKLCKEKKKLHKLSMKNKEKKYYSQSDSEDFSDIEEDNYKNRKVNYSDFDDESD